MLILFFVDQPTATALATAPSNTTVLRGSTVSLNCSTDANPSAHVYQLYFNDILIGNSSSGVFNVTVAADGVYTCVPMNTVGTGRNATVRVTAVGKLVEYAILACSCYSFATMNVVLVSGSDFGGISLGMNSLIVWALTM